MQNLLTENELCEALKVGRLFLYRCRQQGLPFIRLGTKTLRYDFDSVLKWFNDQNVSFSKSNEKEMFP